MPAGFHQPTSDLESIIGIQFGIFSPDEIVKRSVVEVISQATYDGNEPKIGGLFDPRMGVLDNGKTCRSCGQTNHGCPGHFGHYRLARPVYFIQFLPMIRNVLRCICIRCSKLLIDKNNHARITKRRGESRWKAVLDACSKVSRCGQETEDGCGTVRPKTFQVEGIARIVAEWSTIPTAEEGEAAPAKDAPNKIVRQPLEVEYVLRLFRQILDEDVDFMGLSRYWCRPDWMICTVLPIPPPQVRPSVVQDNNQRSEDDLTHKLFEIIKSNKKLQEQINKNSNRNMIDELTTLLQYHVATLVDNKIPGVAPSAQRGGRPLKSLQQRIGSKEGRVRYNIQGKRVEQSARSVITGDPNISIAEVGVPMKIAMNLTRPEMVTIYNRDRLYKYVQNGADVFPGAKSIVRKDGRMISLKHVNAKELVLYNGDTVNRHLMDGDIILFNRQPTLHRMSMMGHRVRVLPFNTFRLNVTVTRPYNADFDGDEMNAHIPQSYEATVELQEIASVPMQIIRPRDAMPVIGVVQDALAGAYLATRPNNFFTRREFMNMMMKNKRFQDVPEPAAAGRYTGQQIIGTLFPPINISMENSRYDADSQDYNKVKIREGFFSQGVLDKGIFNKAGKGIVHTIYNDYGPKEAVDFMDGLQSMVETYLIMKGFSVGISDLIADEETRKRMEVTINEKKKEVDDMILQVHMDLFTNNSGKSNQEEFEAKAIGILNKATVDSGKFGVESLSDENRLMTMVRSGSKGDATNVAQMIACVGQQAPEGRRIPYGFTDRTLPHYKMFDDGAEARGFVEGSFLRGLTPQEFFFHAMSGREGLIDTAVKSVTGDTPIIILENGKTRRVKIGDWIDSQLTIRTKEVEHFDDRNLELLQLTNSVFIPTADQDGKVTWGSITAITRHDPGDQLYEIKTLGGKSVIVTESKALLIWNSESKTFQRMATPDVRPGHYVPVTMNLATPPVIYNSVDMANYLLKTEYLYGTDFHNAKAEVDKVMDGCEKIPSGWWKKNNGTLFTLPYDKKSLFTRTQIRSKTDNIVPGYIYPFTTNRSHSRIPDTFALTKNNGIFIGLFLAEGNVDIKSGYVQITNNSEMIRQFVKDWFEDMRIEYVEQFKVNHIGGNSSAVRGFSTVLAKFLDLFVGHGANKKYVPNEAFTAPDDFILGLLNGYFSGDGTLTNNSIEVGSASSELIDGISMLCTRLGVFGKVFKTQLVSNNLGTEDILPTYRLSIRAQWATLLASKISFIDEEKEKKRLSLSCSVEHRNFPYHNDVILDEIVEINIVSVEKYPKVYDLTVPSTLNFGLANGLHVVDTADTGYTQRQLIKAMEDLMTQHDGTVRDASGKIVQFHYGEDGINSTKIEGTSLPLGKLTEEGLRKKFGLEEVDLGPILVPGTERGDDAEAIEEFVENVVMDRKMLIEGVFGGGRSTALFAPLSIERLLTNFKIKFNLDTGAQTALTPLAVLKGIESVIAKTQPYNKIWCAALRFHLAPHKIILEERFTVEAWDALVLAIVVKNMKARAPPGELVGIVAAQSIGEPATQMSIDRSTFIVLNSAKKSYSGPAGPYIDSLLDSKASSVVSIGNDSVVLDLEDDLFILGVSDKEKTSWKRISQVSRHPANGGLVEVHTRTGRKTIATLSHSFLKRSVKGIVPVLGSDLKIGMRIPVATSISVVPNPTTFVKQGKTTFTLDKDFGWVCGVYLADGCLSGNDVNVSKIAPIVAVKLSAFAKEHGSTFSEHNRQGEYGPSKDNIIHSKDLKNFLLETFNQGSYKKEIGTVVYNAPLAFIHGLISGFFDGDGNVNVERQQIRASSRSKELLQGINRLLGYCSMFGVLSEETSVRIPDKIQYTLSIPRKYAKHYETVVGFNLPEKATALKEVIEYIERDNVHSHQEMIDKIPELGGVIARLGKLLQMPGQSRTYGRWLKKESIGRSTLEMYVGDFKEMIQVYVDPLVVDEVAENLEILESALDADVLWDEITDLVYLDDPKTFVYDFTVPGNDSFMVDDNILVHNTLNSVDWDTEIIIAKNGKIITPQIGEFIDDYYMNCPESSPIQHLANGQIYIELNDGNDWKALSCDENGVMKWTKLEAITRHPVINEDGSNTILEVELESGRSVKATKGESFLTMVGGKIVGTKGSDLKIGDELPIGNSLALDGLGYLKTISLRAYLPPTDYLYGTEVHKALEVMYAGERHWFQKNQGVLFTVPYNRSDSFREAFDKGHNTNVILPGIVYNKHMKLDVSQIPETIELTEEFGYFVGAYLAEGMSNKTQVCITNNDDLYLERVKKLMTSWNVGTHTVCEEREAKVSGIKGTTTSLIIHSTIIAKVMGAMFGRLSYDKTLPDWVLQAPDCFVQGLMDAYICGDGSVDKRDGHISAGSVSKKLLVRLGALLARYGIYSKMTSYMPELGKFKSVSRQYNLSVLAKYSNIFHSTFKLSMDRKQKILDAKFGKRKEDNITCKWKTTKDVVWDKVKSIKEITPMKDGWVYDVTVQETRNFCSVNMLSVRDTFHQAGVSSKSAMTRGVPRLKELLKVTKNPKANSLTITLKPAFRDDKDRVREVVQDLELTLLRDIVLKSGIYYDPDDNSTIIAEDVNVISFFKAMELRNGSGACGPSGLDGKKPEEEAVYSKWILRLQFDREKMFAKNITMDDVYFVIHNAYAHYGERDNNIQTIYSDYNSQKLVMRIRPKLEDNVYSDHLSSIKKFQNTLLNNTIIRGIHGIRAVTWRKDNSRVEERDGKYEEITQYILDTDGTNFVAIMNHPAVDGDRLYSTNVHDIYEQLGIEATRATLYSEINSLFGEADINYRHLGLLCDIMTHAGRLMSADRYGINKMDSGPLAKACFEETEKILLKAALFGEMDPITGVSANIMTGQPIRAGTGFTQILLDEVALPGLMKDLQPLAEDEEEVEMPDQNILNAERFGDDENDHCAQLQTQMNMTLPVAGTQLEDEEEIEVVAI